MSTKSFSGAIIFIIIFLVFALIGIASYCDSNAKKRNAAAAATTLPTHNRHHFTVNQTHAQSSRIHLELNRNVLAQANEARAMRNGSMRIVPLTRPPVEEPVVRTANSSATQLPEYASVAAPILPAPAYQPPLRVRNVDPADLSTSTVNVIPVPPHAPPPAYRSVIVGGRGSAV